MLEVVERFQRRQPGCKFGRKWFYNLYTKTLQYGTIIGKVD